MQPRSTAADPLIFLISISVPNLGALRTLLKVVLELCFNNHPYEFITRCLLVNQTIIEVNLVRLVYP